MALVRHDRHSPLPVVTSHRWSPAHPTRVRTGQNQKRIEEDLRHLAPVAILRPKERATWLCEQAIRNHDPCISCATHFLRLEIEEMTGSTR